MNASRKLSAGADAGRLLTGRGTDCKDTPGPLAGAGAVLVLEAAGGWDVCRASAAAGGMKNMDAGWEVAGWAALPGCGTDGKVKDAGAAGKPARQFHQRASMLGGEDMTMNACRLVRSFAKGWHLSLRKHSCMSWCIICLRTLT